MVKLPALQRNCGLSTFEVEPWNYRSDVPDAVREDKKARTKWANSSSTEHCFFSGFEGINASLRVNKDNPVAKMLALVIDYDRPSMDYEQAVEQVVGYEKAQHLPNYISQTLSGGIRLVWVLESPMNMNTDMAGRFQKLLRKEFHLVNLLPGLDDNAVKDPSKYYEVGENWKQLSSVPVPTAECFMWAQKAFKKVGLSTELEADVPLDRVQAALEAKYKDVKFPKLELGLRMHRFWDSSAENESAAFLMSGGFFCHTGDEGFMGWRDLISDSFMKEFEVEKTGEVVDKFWYDGGKYISRNPVKGEEWMVQNTSDVSLNVAGTFGLLKSPDKKGELSPIERILHQIQLQKGVEGAARFVHRPEGELSSQGKRFINISNVKAISPSGTAGEWGEHFPWLAQYLDGLLIDAFQKNVLLAWWKRFYEGALNQTPNRGHVMVIAGPTACGKTLFNTRMLSASVGGGVDASDYYLNGDDFGGTYFEYGLHMVDDGEPGRHINAQKATAARLKKTAASTIFAVNQKYEKKVQVEWSGRVCVTMNDDPESLKAMPELQSSLEDKIIILRAAEPTGLLNDTPDIEGSIRSELPHLLQWLTEWTPPKEVMGESRFGVKAFCDREIRTCMESGNVDSIFLELLETFIDEVKIDSENTELLIQTSDLVARMNDCERIRSLMKNYGPVHIGHILSRFEKKGYKFESKRKASGTHWEIQYDFRPKEEV
jgi:hypothetical protein